MGTQGDALDVIVGEVKESQARLNPALRRQETVSLAIRRVGCCPDSMVDAEASGIVREGGRHFVMPNGMRCNVRLVAFAGHGHPKGPAHVVKLEHCMSFIRRRLKAGQDVFAGVQFKDQVLSFLELEEKLNRFEADGP